MHRLSTIAVVGMLALTIAGCGSGNEENSTSTPSAPKASAPKAFEKPSMVTQNAANTISSVPGLIQATNANQRTKQVQKGRKDPFAVLFVQAVQTVPNTAKPQASRRSKIPKVVRSSKTSARASLNSRPFLKPNSGKAGRQTSSGQSNKLPALVPNSTLPVLPPPQEPNLARAVAVTGVVQVGNEPQAIVKVPNEATSRYVRVGQRLSNGQVLVKRIEINEGSDPIVVLEQYNTEVSRVVGEEPVNSTTATTTTGIAAPPPPPPSENVPSPGV